MVLLTMLPVFRPQLYCRVSRLSEYLFNVLSRVSQVFKTLPFRLSIVLESQM